MEVSYDGEHFWFRTTGGQQLPVPDTSEQDLFALIDLFRLRFGRDPGPGDPLLFDPRLDTPTRLGRAEIHEATAQLMQDLHVHPAFLYAHDVLGYLITADNARYATAEELARWRQAVQAWCAEHSENPPVLTIVASPRLRGRATPESAAVQEALAHADHQDPAEEKLVIAILMAQKGGREVAVLYYPDFVRIGSREGQRQVFAGNFVLKEATPVGLASFLLHGWVPVAVACGDESPHATFLPVLAALALTGADFQQVIEIGMDRISRLIGEMEG